MTFVEFAQQIRANTAETVESFFKQGRLLIAAKKELGHGNEHGRDGFQQLFEGTPSPAGMSQRKAERLMAIAAHPVLTNPTYVSLLPDSWPTLYELTRLPLDVLQEAIDSGSGKVHSDMELEDARALRPRSQQIEEDILRPLRHLPGAEGMDRQEIEDLWRIREDAKSQPRPKMTAEQRAEEERLARRMILVDAVRKMCRSARVAVDKDMLELVDKLLEMVEERRRAKGARVARRQTLPAVPA